MLFSVSKSYLMIGAIKLWAFAWWWLCISWAWRLCLKAWSCQYNLMFLIMVVAKTFNFWKFGLYNVLLFLSQPPNSTNFFGIFEISF